MTPVAPLQARLVDAKRQPGGVLWLTLRLTAAPSLVIDTPVHLILGTGDVEYLLAAVAQATPWQMSLDDALALGIPVSIEENVL